MGDFSQAKALLNDFKGDAYVYGMDVLSQVGDITAPLGKRAALVRTGFAGSDDYVAAIKGSLEQAGVTVVGEIPGVRPNAPLEDLARVDRRPEGVGCGCDRRLWRWPAPLMPSNRRKCCARLAATLRITSAPGW